MYFAPQLSRVIINYSDKHLTRAGETVLKAVKNMLLCTDSKFCVKQDIEFRNPVFLNRYTSFEDTITLHIEIIN